jgi:hypothetical protein
LIAGFFFFQNVADLFVNHGAIIAQEAKASETPVALLIAGLEEEEVYATPLPLHTPYLPSLARNYDSI